MAVALRVIHTSRQLYLLVPARGLSLDRSAVGWMGLEDLTRKAGAVLMPMSPPRLDNYLLFLMAGNGYGVMACLHYGQMESASGCTEYCHRVYLPSGYTSAKETHLHTNLRLIDSGYHLSEPWKRSDNSLVLGEPASAVPWLRRNQITPLGLDSDFGLRKPD